MAEFTLKRPRHYVLEYDGKWLTYSGAALPITQHRELSFTTPLIKQAVTRYRRQLERYMTWIDGVTNK